MKLNDIKNFLKFLGSKPWIVGLAIFLIALVLRLIAAFKLAWRPDEIVYVDWIGKWFAAHFWSYFFQLKHTIYPPSSPVFGNPPLAMWLLSLGIWIAEKFHFSPLIGARLINVIIGSISTLLLFRFGKKWFNLRTGILAGLAFALLPLAVTNNATAYLETLLVLFIIIGLDLLFNYLKTFKTKYLYWLGFIFGLSLLVKLTVFILIASVAILLPIILYKNIKNKKFWLPYALFILLIVVTPVILWAGFRDLNHLKDMFFLYKSKTYSPYILSYSFPIFRYYFLMIIGVLAPVLILGLIFRIITFFRDFIKSGLEKNKNLFFLVVLLLIYLAYNGIATSYGASYQLMPIIPIVLIIGALGLGQIIDLFSNRLIKIPVLMGILICLVLPLTAFKPQFWGLYSSVFVGGTNNAFKLYPVGIEGEAVPLIAVYLNQTDKDSRTAIIAYDWTLKKYLLDQRTTAPLFTNEGETGGISRAADYLVLPRIYSEGNKGQTAQELLKENPVEIIKVKGVELARIFKLDYTKVEMQKPVTIGSKKDWQIKMINNNPNFEINDDTLKIDYKFTKTFKETDLEDNRLLLTNNRQFSIGRENKGIYLEIFGDGNDKICSIVFSGDRNNFFSNDLECDWHGWKKVYIPFTMFHYSQEGFSLEDNPNLKYSLSLGIVSQKAISGEIQVKNIYLANRQAD